MDLKIVNTDLVTVGEIEMIQELMEYDLPLRVFNVYKTYTKGNDFLKIDEVKHKLIRNIVLGVEMPMIEGMSHKRTFRYGNLLLQTNELEKSLCYVLNYEGRYEFNVSKEKIHIMNEIMEIKEKK